MFSIFPQNDPKQTLRIQRMLMAASSYVLLSNLAWVVYLAGLVRSDIVTLIAGIILALLSQAAIYALLRTGFNKRFVDPSLTNLQMLVAICWITYLLSTVSAIRGVMMTLYFTLFFFGAFQLNKTQLFKLASITLAGFIGVVYLDYKADLPDFDLTISTVQTIILAIVLIWMSYIGDYIHSLQEKGWRKLRSKNEEIEEEKLARTHCEQKLAKLVEAITPNQETSVRDNLTGLLKLNEFQKIVSKQLIIADACNTPLSIARIAIHPLAHMKDTWTQGDIENLTKVIADGIKFILRDQDSVCRATDYDFLLLLPNANKKAALRSAERLCQQIASIDTKAITLKATLGITSWQQNDTTDVIIERAQDTLSSALEAGLQIHFE